MAAVQLVTRHPGTREWLARQGIDAQAVEHLDMAGLAEGAVVIGNLPGHIVAQITARGARYWHIALETPLGLRGTDLTADEMERLGARLVPLASFHDPRGGPESLTGPAVGRPAAPRAPVTLVTLLGAPHRDYAVCRYGLDDRQIESRWLADALIRHGRAGGPPIERVIVIGTAGSGWSLLADLAGLGGSDLEFALFAGVESGTLDPALLARLGGALSSHFGLPVTPLLAPYVDQGDASTLFAAQLALALGGEARVLVDVTFGLRDIMLTVMTTLTALEALRRLTIDKVIYAPMRDARQARADVVSIPAVPDIMAWIRAIGALDAGGETGPLADILAAGSPEISRALGHQALDEKMLRPRRAAERARHLLDLVDASASPVAVLFREALHQRLGWARAGQRLSELQAALARQSLASGDFTAAVALAFEAIISAYIEAGGHLAPQITENALERSRAQEQLNLLTRGEAARADPIAADYRQLKAVRNALLHMSRPPREQTTRLLGNPEALAALIRRVASRLLGN
ncbi:CRISPR-associated protein Csx16 [Ancylobacter sp. WKF20]|uniref:CRISPR-associated protein Csx16 n=1 Tax=Ancylobacter sp. WKF20 TaxID=3039801 RepID=UPI00243427A4|nr:CRISPR-associated protein Csx16 [Ancylobacter sp. WKF20]WGD28396.1 CRISPR-associated protein Csx16 [Ancylobacter sp. WKF20]